MAGSLDRAGLVAVDMARICGNDSLPGLQTGSDHGQVRLGTAHQEWTWPSGSSHFSRIISAA